MSHAETPKTWARNAEQPAPLAESTPTSASPSAPRKITLDEAGAVSGPDPMRRAGGDGPHATLCGATTRSGAPCRQAPIRGAARCRMHGGAAPQVLDAAKERVLEARVRGELARMEIEPIGDPGLAYATLAGEVWAWKELCRTQIAYLEHWDYTDAKAAQDIKPLIAVYERALDRAQKALADMLRIGLTAEALRQAKERPTVEQAAALHGVIQGLLDRLALTPEQQRAVPDALTAALQQEGLL